MSTIPIRVINLPARADRRARMAAQFARLNVQGYSFLAAVHGAQQPDHPLFRHYDAAARRRVRGPGRDLKPSQLGCYASHYLLWQECVETAGPLIVVEDDAILLDNFPVFLDHAAQIARRWPLVWLHDNDKPGRDPSVPVDRVGPFVLRRKLKTHYRTVAYLIDPRAARALLAYSEAWLYPVDDAMCRSYDHGVENIALQPHCVTHDNDSASDITGAADAPLAWPHRIRREAFKGCDQLRRTLHNLAWRLRHRPVR